MSSKGEAKERKRILRIIDKIVNLASDGEYIYRGQPNVAYRTVTSTLYRVMEDAVKEQGGEIEGADWLDMNKVQEEELETARRFDRSFKNKDDDNVEMLSHIQHYSGDTNLIDFTKDYLVALFFACNGEYGESDGADGSVFLIKVSDLKGEGIEMVIPVHPSNRVTAQKSIFIQPPTGVISADIIKSVQIPLELKQSILNYLEAYHDISLSNIYNDLHGYIRNRKAHGNAVKEFYLGLYYSDKNQKVQSLEEKKDVSEKAIKHYNKVIQMTPKHVNAYNNRGLAKWELGDVSGAISDYDKAIALAPDDANPYGNRGLAKHESLGDVQGAISDYDKAIELDPNHSKTYNNRGNVKLQLDDVLGAINDYDKSIDITPQYVSAYYNRGVAKEKLGGRQNLQQALSDSKHAEKLALQQNKQGVVDDAQKNIERVTVKIAKIDKS